MEATATTCGPICARDEEEGTAGGHQKPEQRGQEE